MIPTQFRSTTLLALSACFGLLVAAPVAPAGIIAIPPPGLTGANLIDFGTVQTLAPINGQTINGVNFSFKIAGVASTDATIDGGPGNTNNITAANVEGNTAGVLSMVFPGPQTRMGYGFAVLATTSIPNATTVQLFNAANTSLGTLSAAGAPDPVFTGGFLGAQSDLAFVRADVTFTNVPNGRFAFDNLRYLFNPSDLTAVPEPASLLLFGMGIAGLCAYRWGCRWRAA